MREERRSRRAAGTLAVIAGLAAGTIASSLVALTGGEGAEPAGMRRAAGSPTTPGMSQPKLALLHTPPLLVLRTEAVELRYELVCPAVEARCAPEGTAPPPPGTRARSAARRLRFAAPATAGCGAGPAWAATCRGWSGFPPRGASPPALRPHRR